MLYIFKTYQRITQYQYECIIQYDNYPLLGFSAKQQQNRNKSSILIRDQTGRKFDFADLGNYLFFK